MTDTEVANRYRLMDGRGMTCGPETKRMLEEIGKAVRALDGKAVKATRDMHPRFRTGGGE